MAFEFQGYRSPLTASIAEMIGSDSRARAQAVTEAANARAQATIQSGNAYGSAIQQIGQIPQQMQEQARQRQAMEAQKSEMQLRNMQIGAAQRQIAGQQILASAIKQYTNPQTGETDDKAIANFASTNGFPDLGNSWLKTKTENADNLQKLSDIKRSYQQAVMSTLGDLAWGAKSGADFTAAVGTAAQHGLIDEPSAHQYASAGADDGQWQAIRNQLLPYSPKYQAEQAKLKEPIKAGPEEVVNTPERAAQGLPPLMTGGAKPKDEWESFQTAYANQNKAKDWNSLTPQQQMAGFAQFATSKQTPESQDLQDLRRTMLQLQIGQQPTKEDAQGFAQSMVNHTMAPSQIQLLGGFGTAGAAFKRMVLTEAQKIDPSINWEEAESNYQLVKSPGFQNTVRYMDAVQNSIPRLEQNVAKLGNGKYRSLNDLVNASKGEFNSADVKAFKTDATLVGDEVAKLLQGGGTGNATSDAKLKQGVDLFSSSDDVPAMAATVKEIQYLLGNRRSSLTRGTYLEQQPAAAPANVAPPSKLPPGASVSRGGQR